MSGRGERERSGRGRRTSNAVEEKPSSAGSKKTPADGVKTPDPDLVEVKAGSYTKKCVIPTLCLAVLLAGMAGAGIFFLVYYILIMMTYCPWTQLSTGCYQFFQDNQNWTHAQHLCRGRGGRLAELAGFDKQMDVVNLYTSAGHSPACFWIGGFESDASSMVFTWNISSQVMEKYFTEWESGYPKNRSVPTCVDFCHPDFSWKNKQCALKQNYLCEFG
eukprot:TRINITY_DN13165_c0_g1_i1.p1 TRINITY_DN13165_c0_g1~~TRINITY_DN13165_c0_g1_i1.p1  ORF type:complete len:218 (-),score=42.18 TRINITY_DN13165_c0_g1_i1:197-850(-)